MRTQSRKYFVLHTTQSSFAGHPARPCGYPLWTGVAAMRSKARISSHPVHPMLVMFPFGLWVASFVFDLLGRVFGNADLFAAGFYALIGGCIGAVLAAVPGVVDLFSVVPPDSSARKRGYI